jgi:hypothetical protein
MGMETLEHVVVVIASQPRRSLASGWEIMHMAERRRCWRSRVFLFGRWRRRMGIREEKEWARVSRCIVFSLRNEGRWMV